MNKEILSQQIADLEAKLAELKAEVNKPAPIINYWKPKKGDIFFYVDAWGNYTHSNAKDNITDRYRVFQTREKAQAYAEYVKAEEALKAEIARLNEGWWPNWKNCKQINYYVKIEDEVLEVDYYLTAIKVFPNFMYLKSKDLAEQLIETHSVQLKIYLSY